MKIVLIGGGTGGHILPLLPLINDLNDLNTKVELVVADQALDKKIVKDNFPIDLKVHYFRTGKIRRYLSVKNIPDAGRIIHSVFKAKTILQKMNPDIIFFKGGFVGFPFFVANQFLSLKPKPIYCHESDIIEGKLTSIAKKYAKKVFYNFGPNTHPLFFQSSNKTSSSKNKLPQICIMGASQGAQYINELFHNNADNICKKNKVILISGKGKEIKYKHKNFSQYTSLKANELQKIVLASDLIISRAGSGSLFEIITAQKPSIIIPLPSAAQNHQQKNAEYFEKQGLITILKQGSKEAQNLPKIIDQTLNNKKLLKHLKSNNIHCKSKSIANEITKDRIHDS